MLQEEGEEGLRMRLELTSLGLQLCWTSDFHSDVPLIPQTTQSQTAQVNFPKPALPPAFPGLSMAQQPCRCQPLAGIQPSTPDGWAVC